MGYGDSYPLSTLGRIMGVTAAFFGYMLISLLIVFLIDIFTLKPAEARVYINSNKYNVGL